MADENLTTPASDEEELEIEIVEEEEAPVTPQAKETVTQDEPAPELEDDDETEESPDDQDERSKYGKRAQKRIQKLITERKVLEAQNVQLHNQVQAANQQSQTTVIQAQGQSLQDAEHRLEAESHALEGQFNEAYNSGDQKELFKVQQEISRVQSQLTNVQAWKAHQKNQAEDLQRQAQQPTPIHQGQQGQVPQQQVERAPDERTQSWVQKNSAWFGVDKDLTDAAFNIHRDLAAKGFNPDDHDDEDFGSTAYWQQLDNRMERFLGKQPQGGGTSPAPAQTVVGRTRGAAPRTGKQKVKLSRSELDMAERLNIKPEQYAREKLKRQETE